MIYNYIRIKYVIFVDFFLLLTKGTVLATDTCICSSVGLWVTVI